MTAEHAAPIRQLGDNTVATAHGGRRTMTPGSPKIAEPLLVRPRDAWRMLGCGNTRGYQLLAAGELESFLDGRARKITVASIHRFIARRLAAGATEAEPQPRRRGRPRKSANAAVAP
jgi:hypothetical protein